MNPLQVTKATRPHGSLDDDLESHLRSGCVSPFDKSAVNCIEQRYISTQMIL
jgi:hypothetical protein